MYYLRNYAIKRMDVVFGVCVCCALNNMSKGIMPFE